MTDNDTCRGAVADLRDTRMPQDDESITDHSAPVKHVEDVLDKWIAMILAEMVRRCPAEMVKSTGPLKVDSSAIETTIYETPRGSA